MAFALIANPTQSHALQFFFVVLVSISAFSLFSISDARSSLDTFKISAGSKVSYNYNADTDSMDLPTHDAYDFSLLAPSPFADQTPTTLISNPPNYSPSPSPNVASPLPGPFGLAPSPHPSNPYGPQPGPPQLKSPPAGAPKHSSGPDYAVWCIARPTVPESMIQRAMDYACGNGADCGSVRPNGPCFVPNNLVSHASYAFNSYWQRTKVAGGSCDFGGTAMLITEDPSYNGCHFIFV